jgi:ATP-dependent DNA helicase RecG
MVLRKQVENKDQLSFKWGERPVNQKRPIIPLLTPKEIFDSCDESLLRQFHEDSRLEKKPSTIHPKELGEYFSMWANTQPNGGIIVVGINKDKTFEGCTQLSSNRLNKIEQTPDTYCPDAEYKIKRISIKRDKDNNEDFIIVFWVNYHRTRLIATTDGRVFVRIGSSKKEVKGEALSHLRAEKGEISFERESCNLPYPQDFDTRAIEEFVETVRNARRWDVSHSREKILSLMHLGTISDDNIFSPNIALTLLFSKDPRWIIPGCRIRFLRFSGETEGTGTSWNAVKDEYIDGTIPFQIQQIDQILKSQLRIFSRLGKGGKFYTSPEYPEFSWYEAIVNACVHRSYGNAMKNMNIFVKMFDDRLVIESPGGFPPFVTPQNIYNMHQPRNPYLMEAMYHLKFVKCAAEGTKRIRSEMRDMDLPEPEFKQEDIGNTLVRVTLRNNIKQRKVWVDADVIELLGAQLANSLSENQKRCINFCAENGQISVSDTQRLTGMTWPAASKMLKQLTEQGILVHDHKKGVERDPRARFKLREVVKTQ